MREKNLDRWLEPHLHPHGIERLTVFLFMLLLSWSSTNAQPPADQSENSLYDAFNSDKFDPTITAIITAIVASFLFVTVFAVFIRKCSRNHVIMDGGDSYRVNEIERSTREPPGLDRFVIQTFPSFTYSQVKGVKLGRETMECAVCLSEFQDDETIRLLPKCDHVFHGKCIDTWLAYHVTCPVCRADLSPESPKNQRQEESSSEHEENVNRAPSLQANETRSHEVSITVNEKQNGPTTSSAESQPTHQAVEALRTKSHSTGHSIAMEKSEDKYRLRLPEDVRKQLIEKATFNRSATINARLINEWRRGKMYDMSGVGSSTGRQTWRFVMSPPFVTRQSSVKSARSDKPPLVLLPLRGS
ncbi:hypothetical protein K2173_014858 [Erythroxylum novogranatense]|uniref:RING-type E3 ubiquitin transferase n=1 Tax=Erythroxylum novogranatense TaxID=1862640 RepID=A0AAV8TH57_9ROSI|nr:hypothetical protein K2173_014858 [Erythroxylum novogranatense]